MDLEEDYNIEGVGLHDWQYTRLLTHQEHVIYVGKKKIYYTNPLRFVVLLATATNIYLIGTDDQNTTWNNLCNILCRKASFLLLSTLEHFSLNFLLN